MCFTHMPLYDAIRAAVVLLKEETVSGVHILAMKACATSN